VRDKVSKEQEGKPDLKRSVLRTPLLEQISILIWCQVLQKNPLLVRLMMITG